MNAAPDQLQSFVRRIEALEDEIGALNRDKSEVYKDAKGDGFDTKVLRKVIAARRLDASERNEQDAIFDLYWDAIHGVASARVEIIDEFDPATGEIKSEVAEAAAAGESPANHRLMAVSIHGGENVAPPPAHAPEQPGHDNGSVSTPAEGGAHSAPFSHEAA